MSECQDCGTWHTPSANFCSGCGKAVPRTEPSGPSAGDVPESTIPAASTHPEMAREVAAIQAFGWGAAVSEHLDAETIPFPSLSPAQALHEVLGRDLQKRYVFLLDIHAMEVASSLRPLERPLAACVLQGQMAFDLVVATTDGLWVINDRAGGLPLARFTWWDDFIVDSTWGGAVFGSERLRVRFRQDGLLDRKFVCPQRGATKFANVIRSHGRRASSFSLVGFKAGHKELITLHDTSELFSLIESIDPAGPTVFLGFRADLDQGQSLGAVYDDKGRLALLVSVDEKVTAHAFVSVDSLTAIWIRYAQDPEDPLADIAWRAGALG